MKIHFGGRILNFNVFDLDGSIVSFLLGKIRQ